MVTATPVRAQPTPWSVTSPQATSEPVPASPPMVLRWPRIPAAQGLRFTPAEPVPEVAPPSTASDPGAGAYFQMPTGRVLRYGDFMGTYMSALGWVGLRYGFSRHLEVGVGLPFYFTGLSVDARVSFVRGSNVAAAWWAYATVPVLPSGDRPASSLGFTWAWAGLGWATGPVLTLWGDRVAASVGLHLAQRTGLGGAWLLGHATLDVRIIDGVKFLAQAVVFHEASQERAARAESLLGNGSARLLPYALAGVRLYTRRFSADLGAMAPLARDVPLASDKLPVLPWLALSHLF